MKNEEVQGTKRAKEGKIKNVIEKVSKWLSLYNGSGNSKKRISLDDGAKEVGVKKKTLYDWLRNLREGKKLGFDFHKKAEEGIGVLRNFIAKGKSL